MIIIPEAESLIYILYRMTGYMLGFQPAVSSFWDQSIVYSLRLQGFYAIRSAKAERYLKWTSSDNERIFVDRSALAERKSKEYRQKPDNINAVS